MGSRGDAYDNALAESFFASLKKELVRRRSWPTRRELRSAVFDYVEALLRSVSRYVSTEPGALHSSGRLIARPG